MRNLILLSWDDDTWIWYNDSMIGNDVRVAWVNFQYIEDFKFENAR